VIYYNQDKGKEHSKMKNFDFDRFLTVTGIALVTLAVGGFLFAIGHLVGLY
jgi:hypothetical protein